MKPPEANGAGEARPGGERRAVARGVAWGSVESLTSAAVGLLLTPLIVRTCGLEGLGLWAASWSLAHTSGLFDLGVGASYSRFTSRAIALRDVAALNRTLAAGTGFHLVIALLIAVAAVCFGPAALGIIAPAGSLAIGAGHVFACALATVLLRTVLSAYRAVIAGAQRVEALGRIGSAVALFEGMGAATGLALGWGLSGMAVNSLLAAIVASLAEARVAHGLVAGLRLSPFRAGREEWRELFSFGLRLQLVRSAEILGAHAPRLALAAGAGLAAAGMYDLGARVANILMLAALPLPVIQPLAGRLAALAEGARLRTLLERATRYVALLGIPCAAWVWLDAEAMLVAWTGREVPPPAALAARLLACALLCGCIVSPLRLVMRGCGRPGPEAVAALAGAVLNVLLAMALAPLLGAPGVAGAALAGALLSAVLLGIGARGAVPGLAGRALCNLPGPIIASAAGFLSAAGLRLLPGSFSAAARAEALGRLLPDVLLLSGVTLFVALLTRVLLREDAEALAVALLPWRRADDAAATAGGRS